MSKKGGSTRRVVDYFISLHYGVCWGPVDSFDEVIIKDKVAWDDGVTDNADVWVEKENLFGGDEQEGGIRGTISFLFGKSTQVLSETIAGYVGLTSATCPAYRGIASVLFHNDRKPNRGFMIGQNVPYIPEIQIGVSRTPVCPGLSAGVPLIGVDANPVYIIYECYTNTDWGLGWSASSFDLPAWNAAATTVHSEGIGLSMGWFQQTEVEKFVSEVQDHIAAAIYTDPVSGLLSIRLFRADYDLNNALEFNPDNCDLDSYERQAIEDTTNEIVVTYTDPESEEDATVTLQDLANIAAQGGRIKSDSRNFYGARSPELATQLGARDLRLASYPAFSAEIIADRTVGQVTPGEVIKLVWPEEGIVAMACRVTDVRRGKKKDGRLKISVIEDVWGLDYGVYAPPPATQWSLPATVPTNFPYKAAFTVPYPSLQLAGIDPVYADVYVGLLAQHNDTTYNFTLTTDIPDPTGGTKTVDIAGMLLSDYREIGVALNAEVSTVLPAADVSVFLGETDLAVGQLHYIGPASDDTVNEIVLIESYNGGTDEWTLARGMYDTVPRDWPANTPMWAVPFSTSIVHVYPRPATVQVDYYLRPRTLSGLLDLGSTNVLQYTPSERPHLPFRPANVAVDGDAGFARKVYNAEPANIPVTWSNRNRAEEDTVALKWDEATISPETGQTTNIRFTDLSDTLIVEYTGLTGTSHTVPWAAPWANGDSVVKMKVTSERDGLESLQAFVREIENAVPVTYTGSGAINAPMPSLTAGGTVTVTASGAVTAPTPALSGDGFLNHGGLGSINAPVATLSGTGTIEATASGGVSTPVIGLAGTGTVSGTLPAGTDPVDIYTVNRVTLVREPLDAIRLYSLNGMAVMRAPDMRAFSLNALAVIRI